MRGISFGGFNVQTMMYVMHNYIAKVRSNLYLHTTFVPNVYQKYKKLYLHAVRYITSRSLHDMHILVMVRQIILSP